MKKMMNLRERLISEARRIISDDDPSHDMAHALRVLANAEYIAQFEGGDLEVIIPAALFHDAVNYPKDDPRASYSAEESSRLVGGILEKIPYDRTKIARVSQAIIEHSYSNGIRSESLDSKIVQDADRLEATGAISIMRTFASSGQMKRRFYDPDDPFCSSRQPGNYAIDLFYNRLLRVKDLMNTETAKRMAEQRTEFLYDFLGQLEREIDWRYRRFRIT
jgi:uncharacterized protein